MQEKVEKIKDEDKMSFHEESENIHDSKQKKRISKSLISLCYNFRAWACRRSHVNEEEKKKWKRKKERARRMEKKTSWIGYDMYVYNIVNAKL